jgi:hypothetical protein
MSINTRKLKEIEAKHEKNANCLKYFLILGFLLNFFFIIAIYLVLSREIDKIFE